MGRGALSIWACPLPWFPSIYNFADQIPHFPGPPEALKLKLPRHETSSPQSIILHRCKSLSFIIHPFAENVLATGLYLHGAVGLCHSRKYGDTTGPGGSNTKCITNILRLQNWFRTWAWTRCLILRPTDHGFLSSFTYS